MPDDAADADDRDCPADAAPAPALVAFAFFAPARQEVVVPPLNFAVVMPGIYRSGYPNRKNYPFLRKLRLSSIVYVAPLQSSNEPKRAVQAW
jgi:hypothetical protein